MEQQIHTVHFKADKKLLDFIHDKINKLQLFNQAITSIEVFLILENDKEKPDSIKNKTLGVFANVEFRKSYEIMNWKWYQRFQCKSVPEPRVEFC